MEIKDKIDYFIVPKNSGLWKCREIANSLIDDISELQEVRGEDVPLFVEKLIKENKNAIGITGEDLFKEFSINNRDTELKILKRYIWEDSTFIYKKPALCFLVSKKIEFENLPKNLKVCISSKYKEIAKKYFINTFENRGYKIEKIYVSGATESFFEKGLVDGVIDVVCSGESAKNANLKVYEKIFESDIVIIGKPDYSKKLSLEMLYQKICKRIEEKSEISYTNKIANDYPLLYRKIIEESAEVITAKNREELLWELSDLMYFLLVLMAKRAISLDDIERENARRDRK
ncbi:MAG: phosphoribosyl-ATP diphosphatase [Nanoarchaeota archaeon]